MYKLHGLYVITDPTLCGDALLKKVEQAISGGAQIIQYRNKQADYKTQLKQAVALQQLCKNHNRLFLINDNVSLAVESNADGVHLGQTDGDIATARKSLGGNRIIGVTCHNDINAAKNAESRSANYVAFGRFYPSKTKPLAPHAEIEILRQAKSQLNIPIVAIGGISVENATNLITAGADMLAAIHAIFAQQNVRHAAEEFTKLFPVEQ